jgi:hypothetical protein
LAALGWDYSGATTAAGSSAPTVITRMSPPPLADADDLGPFPTADSDPGGDESWDLPSEAVPEPGRDRPHPPSQPRQTLTHTHQPTTHQPTTLYQKYPELTDVHRSSPS